MCLFFFFVFLFFFCFVFFSFVVVVFVEPMQILFKFPEQCSFFSLHVFVSEMEENTSQKYYPTEFQMQEFK